MAGKKDYRIENLRAAAILLVVFGHSIILYQNDWSLFTTQREVPILNMIKEMIDVIQMPLFISLSGYLFYFTYKKASFTNLVKKKTVRLLIPYFCIGLGWMLPIRMITGYSGYQNMRLINIIVNKIVLCEDNGHLWFLPFLFFCFLIMFILKKAMDHFRIHQLFTDLLLITAGFILYLEWWRIPSDIPFGNLFRSVGIWYFWFPLGYLVNEHKENLSRYFKKSKYLLFIIGIILMITYITGRHPYILITRMILLISLFLLRVDRKNKAAEIISSNSFGIYLFHSPLVYFTYAFIPNAFPLIVVIINFIVFGIFAFLLTQLIRASKLRFIIGE